MECMEQEHGDEGGIKGQKVTSEDRRRRKPDRKGRGRPEHGNGKPKASKPLAAPVTCLQKRQCHAASTRSRIQGLPKHTGLTMAGRGPEGRAWPKRAPSSAEWAVPGDWPLDWPSWTGPRKTRDRRKQTPAFHKLDLTCWAYRAGL